MYLLHFNLIYSFKLLFMVSTLCQTVFEVGDIKQTMTKQNACPHEAYIQVYVYVSDIKKLMNI